jgi:hypothetical protein
MNLLHVLGGAAVGALVGAVLTVANGQRNDRSAPAPDPTRLQEKADMVARLERLRVRGQAT